MTEKVRKSIVNRAIKERELRKSYNSTCFLSLLGMTIFSLIFIGFSYWMFFKSTYDQFSHISVAMFFINPCITFPLLEVAEMSKFPIIGVKRYFSFIGVLFRIICLVEAMIPMVVFVAIFNFDEYERTFTAPLWKILVWTPLVFVGLLVMSIFHNTPSPYSNVVNSSGNQVMTKTDWMIMRRDQEIAGIDPDKMPVVLSPNQIKSMTKSDWNTLLYDLEIAGFDVRKKYK